MTQTINPGGDDEPEDGGWQISINGTRVDEVTILSDTGHRHTIKGPFTQDDVGRIHTHGTMHGVDSIADPEGNLATRIDFQPPERRTVDRPFI